MAAEHGVNPTMYTALIWHGESWTIAQPTLALSPTLKTLRQITLEFEEEERGKRVFSLHAGETVQRNQVSGTTLKVLLFHRAFIC